MTMFTPTDLAPSEVNTAHLPTDDLRIERIVQAPADFMKVHPRTHEVIGGLTCRTHQVWDFDCEHCNDKVAKRALARAERATQHVGRVLRTDRFGR